MRLKEKYEKLKKAAQADVRAVRNRQTKFGGSYKKDTTSIDLADLKSRTDAAKILGFETHVRIHEGVVELYHVAAMPPEPFDVRYA